MSNLTITIDDDLLRTARVKAVQQGTSVNEVCRQAIAAFVAAGGADAAERAHARAKAFWEHSHSLQLGPRPDSGKKPSRDALYEDMLAEKSPRARLR